jgi:hypothetical protein
MDEIQGCPSMLAANSSLSSGFLANSYQPPKLGEAPEEQHEISKAKNEPG